MIPMITNLTKTKTKPHVDSVTTLYSMQMLHQRTELIDSRKFGNTLLLYRTSSCY